ncbi:MAG: universal stress protein [Caulobacter sp.]
MGYRDILVQVDETRASRPRAVAAAALAARSQAQLTGVFLRSQFMRTYMGAEVITYMAPETIEAILKDHADAVARAAEAARELFESAAADAGVQSDWLEVEGDDDFGIIACARRFDLTVLPPVALTSMGVLRIHAADIGMAAGGPILVVPEAGLAATPARRILVAWKGARESARALNDAWPLLAEAEDVHVLIVSKEAEAGPEGLLQRHFERHGCKANIVVDRSDDASAADILRRQVKALDADLLVMGLYGRPRLSEWVLGGVSRDLLAAPPAGLFLSH